MAEHDGTPTPLGSVADEAARLMDALGSWAQATVSDQDVPESRSGSTPAGQQPTAEDATDPADDTTEPADDATGRCDACGARAGVGRAESCRVCPVCQGISLLRSVRPETVERLADLATAVAAILRDLAVQRRDETPYAPDSAAGEGGGRSGGGRRAPVQDIDVTETSEQRTGTTGTSAEEHGR